MPCNLNSAGRRVRHGVTIIWVAVSMAALLGFCSLAVDLGRVQTTKTQLEVACDAAARAGASQLSNGWSAVQSAAYSTALQNTADGSPVAINSTTDIQLLDWPSTTPLSSTQIASANAVQIVHALPVPLLFGQGLGMSNATVHASSICQSNTNTGANSFQVVGVTSVTVNSGGTSDSYNSNSGSYWGQTPGNNGSIACGGTCTNNGGSCKGTIYTCGGSQSCSGWDSGHCSGGCQQVSSISCPTPSAPSGCTNLGNVNCSWPGQTVTLNSGNYTCSGLTCSNGTLNVNCNNGPVNIYCTGSVNLCGGNVCTSSNCPNNLHINVCNNSPVTVTSSTSCYGCINAPQSNVNITGGSTLYGSCCGNNLTIDSNCAIHYDEALGPNSAGQSSTTLCQVK